MLRQAELMCTHETSNISCQVANSKHMQYHAKPQSALQCMMELERCLGVVRSDKSLCHEHVQLGLEVSVAGEHGVWAAGFPFMMVLVVLVAMIIPNAYKYAFSA